MKTEIRYFHLFCGLGGGAKGFNTGEAWVGAMAVEFRCIGGADNEAAAITDSGICFMLEAWRDDPPELIIFENVPHIANRAAAAGSNRRPTAMRWRKPPTIVASWAA